ncbi:DUF11 domain-containing protein [Micromonospora okii]|uniref:DUF11 domain-containing protein n=1 Tax=Micromonospora okii TaxID=1182970 RepID=UPI001E2D9474|nr:DUF11 domain-containing protein [Micromonospora okii]
MRPTRRPHLVAAAIAVCALLGGWALAVAPARVSSAEPADPPPVTELRVAYLATGHRSIGLVSGSGAAATAEPLFGGGPAHFDDEASADGDVVAWVSRRESELAQLWVRSGAGEATRLTADPGQVAGWPAVSPDGTRIAFEQTRDGVGSWHDLFVVGVDGSGLRQVTDGTNDNRRPTWSPDGTALAFERLDYAGVPQVHRVPVDGGPATALTARPEGAGEPAWDPDPAHDRIAYTAAPGSPDGRQIHLMNSVGGDDRLLLDPRWESHQASWSPDGTTVAFLSRSTGTDGARGEVDLLYTGVPRPDWCPCEAVLRLAEDRRITRPGWYVPPGTYGARLLVNRTTAPDRYTVRLQDIRPDATDPRDLGLTVLREDPGAATDPDLLWRPVDGDPWTARPAYSPDGRRIVVNRFETVAGRRVSRLWVVDADGGNPRPLPLAGRGDADLETDPAWSPDGTRIAYALATPGGPSRVVVADAVSGARLLAVPSGGASDSQPAWSPDGKTLALVRGQPDGAAADSHVWTVQARDGAGQRDLTDASCPGCTVADYGPSFSPDNTRIAFGRGADGLVVTDTTGGGCQVLTPPGVGCAGPLTGSEGPYRPRDVAWSPDGSALAFNSRRSAELTSREYVKTYDFGTAVLDGLTWEVPGRHRKPAWQRSVDVATAAPEPPAPVRVGERTSVTVTVTDRGPTPAANVRLDLRVPEGLRVVALEPEVGSCRLDPPGCDLGPLGLGRTVRVRVELTGVTAGTYPLTWSVGDWTADARPSDNEASVPVAVTPAPAPTTVPPTTPPASPSPAPTAPTPTGLDITVTVNPTPGYVGGLVRVTYTVRNIGARVATGVRITPALPARVPVRTRPAGCAATSCPVPDLAPGAGRRLTFVLAPDAATATTTRGTVVADGGLDDTAQAPFRVLRPRIVAVPEIGPPGFVTSVRGTDFPPGVPVRLAWDVGLTVAANPAVPARDGTFAAQLLVVPRDQLGPRKILATGPGFGVVRTDFRVVMPAQQPPGLLGRGW